MAEIGDRIAVASKGGSRSGVVTSVSGAMITVRWDTGEETSLIPGPGVLSVVTSRLRTPSARTRSTTPGGTAPARKTSVPGSQSGVAKKPVAKKPGPAKKSMAKGSSSGRTTGKKTR